MKRFKQITSIFLLTVFIISCTNLKEEVKTSNTLQVDTLLTKHIDFIESTIQYLCYAIPTNYWYPQGTTLQEILDDNFDRGLEGLTELESIVKIIDGSFSKRVKEKIDDLLTKISTNKAEIVKIQEAKNSFLGMFLSSSVEMFGSLGTSSDEGEEAPMPEEIVIAMDSLKTVITVYYKSVLNAKLIQIENNSMEKLGYPDFSEEERIEIKETLLGDVIRKVKTVATNKYDTSCIDIVLSYLVDMKPFILKTQEINEFVESNMNKNINMLAELTKSEIKMLKHALVYEFSISPKIFNIYNGDISNYSTYTFNEKPLIQVTYSYGTQNTRIIIFYYNDGTFRTIKRINTGGEAVEAINEYQIRDIDIKGIIKINKDNIELKGTGYSSNDDKCCPTYYLTLTGRINEGSIILNDIVANLEDWNDKSNITSLKGKRRDKPIIRMFNRYLSNTEWKAIEKLDIYKNDDFKDIIGYINGNEKFKIIDLEYVFYDLMEAKITKVLGNSFTECEPNSFNVGDTIKLLIGYGECEWSVLDYNQIKYTKFIFDQATNKLTESTYDGCNMIEGDLIKSTENRDFIAKVRTNNNDVGWILISTNGEHISEWNYMQQDY